MRQPRSIGIQRRSRRSATTGSGLVTHQLGGQFGLADPGTDVHQPAGSATELQREGADQCGHAGSGQVDRFAAGDVDRPVGEDQHVRRGSRPRPGTLLHEIEKAPQDQTSAVHSGVGGVGAGPDTPGVHQPVDGAPLRRDRPQRPPEVLRPAGAYDDLAALLGVVLAGSQRHDLQARLLQADHQVQRDLRVPRQQDRRGRVGSPAGAAAPAAPPSPAR